MDIYTLVIIVTFVAFVTLAALLLLPVYFFIKRQEQQASQKWTPEALRKRMREMQAQREAQESE